MKRPVNFVFIVAFGLLAWVGWRADRVSANARSSALWVAHTHEVLEILTGVFSSLQDAETGQRGYLLTGQDEHLVLYRTAVARIGGQLANLRALLAYNPEQSAQLQHLTNVANRRLALLQMGIAVRKLHGLPPAAEFVKANQGKILMDSARAVVAGMEKEERDLLQARSQHADALARETELAIALGGGFGLLLLLGSTILLVREIRLRIQKNFLRTVVDANPQLVFIKDWDGRFVLANRAVAEVYGTTVEHLEGKTDADFNPNGAEVERFLQADREVIASGRVLNIPEEAVTNAETGAIRWFQTIKVPLVTADGPQRQVLGVSTDITARRLAEDQLRRTAEELRALVQASPLAIVGIDLDGKVLSWYGGAQAMFGWTGEEVVGRPLANVPPEKDEEFRALRGRVKQGDSIVGLETYRLRKDGSRIDVSISYAPLHDRSGRIVGAIIVYQDITERRLMAEQRQAREAAEAASRAKSNFLANMSHELRTPLNAIIGFSELLQDQTFGSLNEKQVRYIQNVHTSGRHLLQLVNDILDLAKIEAGRLVLEPETLDLKTLLADIQRGIEPLAVAKRQSFKIEVPDQLPTLIADRAKLKQVMYNLLSNAIKFTAEGGRVGMRASAVQRDQGQPQIEVAVWDTGIGIAPEDLSRLFLEFEQLDSSYVREQEGTGLGLALTKRLIEAHGGRIWVESALQKGTTFTFVLPAARAQGDATAPQSCVLPIGHAQGRPLVLVVEDETTGRELLTHYLVENGYAVTFASTGAEALERARRLQPAAISLDILLPDEHGLEVLGKLRADPETKDIPVIVVSITDDRELGLSAGAAAWLVKPVQRRQFIEALDRLMPNGTANGNRLALVVDDDAEAVELASDILEQRGFEVLQAFGGSEGLNLALERLPALIILDLSMPGVSGFTVAQQLRANPRTRHTPILVSTALDLTAAEREKLLSHVQTIVPKSGVDGILDALDRLGLVPRSGAPHRDRKAESV